MTESQGKNLNVLPEMRALAEQSVAQARCTIDDLMAASQRAASTFEGNAAAVQASTRDLQGRAMAFAERNVAASFDFAEELLRARDAEDVMKLQADFMTSQIQALSEQAREMAREIARQAAAPAGSGRPPP